MNNLKFQLLTFSFLCGLSAAVFGQQLARNEQNDLYNEKSVRPVRKDDIMFKKSLWFRIDLRQKTNIPLFSQGNEITQLIIDAVKADVIKPYRNDSLQTRLSKKDFLENLRVPLMNDLGAEETFDDSWSNESEAWGDEVSEEPVTDQPVEYLPNQLYVIELKEDLIFDRRESRMKHDVQAVTLIIPAEQNPLGIDKEIGSFSYKELVNSLFQNNPDAIWYNTQNGAAHLNLADAFDLRLWHGMLVKYENPRDSRVVELYNGGKRALQASQQAVYKLMEYEALLWEY